jgi:hypothetical protein
MAIFSPKNWIDGSTTPLSSAALEEMETRLANWPAQKPHSTDRAQFVSLNGLDSQDGLSRGTAKRTIQAGIDALNGAGVVYLESGYYDENVEFKQDGQRIIGMSGWNYSGGTLIRGTSDTSTIVTCNNHRFCGMQDVMIGGANTTWNGVALNLLDASFFKGSRIGIRNPSGTAWGVYGGVGLQIEHCEGMLFQGLQCTEMGIGIRFITEASCNTFITTRQTECVQDLVFDLNGVAGGNTFIEFKSVAGRLAAPDKVYLGGGGENVFIKADWDEGWAPNTVRILSPRNHFIDSIGAPQTNWIVEGHENIFTNQRFIGGTLEVKGQNNVFRQPYFLFDTSYEISNTTTVVDQPRFANSAVIKGQYLAPTYTLQGSATDTADFAPTAIGGLQGWYKADAITPVADGAAVGTWPDSSGNGRNATQATGGNQPTYQTLEKNNLPVVRFDGSDDMLDSTCPIGGATQTVFVVAKITDFSAARTLVGPQSGAGLQLRANATSGAEAVLKSGTATIGTGGTNLIAGQWYILQATYNHTTGAWALYGPVSTVTGTTANGSGTNVQTLSAASLRIGRNGTSEPMLGDIAEVLVYNSVLSDTDRRRVENYLGTKWAVPST